jgi:hypothetical protein
MASQSKILLSVDVTALAPRQQNKSELSILCYLCCMEGFAIFQISNFNAKNHFFF